MKKTLSLNITLIAMPVVSCWIVPLIIKSCFYDSTTRTYNSYPKLIFTAILGILLGLLMVWMVKNFIKDEGSLSGCVIGLILCLLMEINLFKLLFIWKGYMGSTELIPLFLGFYAGMTLFKVKKHMA